MLLIILSRYEIIITIQREYKAYTLLNIKEEEIFLSGSVRVQSVSSFSIISGYHLCFLGWCILSHSDSGCHPQIQGHSA